MYKKYVFLTILIVLLPACSSLKNDAEKFYNGLVVGTFTGKLVVEWINYDEFVFVPDVEDPLTFTRANGEKIIPGHMRTDGGSIPRPMWAFRNYSPWGFAPAYIVHDWIFSSHHCNPSDKQIYSYSMKDAGIIMAEAIKTMMEDPEYEKRSELSVYSIYVATVSPFAILAWEGGSCEHYKPRATRSLARYVIDFTQEK